MGGCSMCGMDAETPCLSWAEVSSQLLAKVPPELQAEVSPHMQAEMSHICRLRCPHTCRQRCPTEAGRGAPTAERARAKLVELLHPAVSSQHLPSPTLATAAASAPLPGGTSRGKSWLGSHAALSPPLPCAQTTGRSAGSPGDPAAFHQALA